MSRPPSPLPPGLGASFARREAVAAGVTERRLRAKDLETPFRGVRARPEKAIVDTDEDDPLAADRRTRRRVLRLAQAYTHVMPAHAFFAARTAAVIYRAPIAHGDDLDVGVHVPARSIRRRGVRGIKVERKLATIREFDGLRLSSPASTWAMLASELSVRELVIVGDGLVRVPRDDRGVRRPLAQLTDIEQLRRAMAAGRRPGVSRLREAVELIRVGSSSPLETEYRLDAAASGLPDPELDVDIMCTRGRRLGITEIAYRGWKVLVEIEGDHHRTSRKQWNRDIEKYAAYVAEGWEVIRLTSAHIRGADPKASAIVREVLYRRGWRP
ncbi:hypothetical protein [Microbacterium rhizomatis]|uniref:DUF559 domain-containing protein n=1 Tax=Microbacterium rhizomatis TaxID=1631477 RepID=A0A5J5J8Q5_9MICO|nr:hypothetical protein [Microbacterium rhizomatis]KAA9111554.1 hypothetical protein F6B43_08325 [Microbacterium rhizomatis]